VKLVGSMSPEELAGWICDQLHEAGIEVTLTGGACVSIWTNGAYVSRDLDFVEHGIHPRKSIRKVMRALGFEEEHRYFVHPGTDFVVEFPSGPLAVGDSPVRSVAERTTSQGTLRLLTPTDCVKDRLAAFFHWRDREALQQAMLVAKSQPVDLKDIRSWARSEKKGIEYEIFVKALGGA
jgi:hypothetical protein